MSKLTKVNKWANKNGYCVKIREYIKSYHLLITVNESLSFDVSFQESTIYHSIQGKEGRPKGVYLAINRKNRPGFSFPYSSQEEIILKMEEEISNLTKN
ncbi:hypothetical protein EC501_18140 [Lysinibacillus halotolerans]|uniref:Uncharacterized protein n=1 Tax=Lysinibacillus halotolerans TaxID=1368476 RepID=A0A3M8H0G9_9BACI|nr:hypothetical protein EC501_18140 [Lysinibacillus halotolerans]